MKYQVKKLDGRYSHRKYFKYCAVFQSNDYGPLHFNNVLKAMITTYGYSAEIRDWTHIQKTHHNRKLYNLTADNMPDVVNYSWSWSNGYGDLRIYFKSDKELAFFKLKHNET